MTFADHVKALIASVFTPRADRRPSPPGSEAISASDRVTKPMNRAPTGVTLDASFQDERAPAGSQVPIANAVAATTAAGLLDGPSTQPGHTPADIALAFCDWLVMGPRKFAMSGDQVWDFARGDFVAQRGVRLPHRHAFFKALARVPGVSRKHDQRIRIDEVVVKTTVYRFSILELTKPMMRAQESISAQQASIDRFDLAGSGQRSPRRRASAVHPAASHLVQPIASPAVRARGACGRANIAGLPARRRAGPATDA